MAESTSSLRQVHDAYTDARGRAMSASSVRLRWAYRRLQRLRDGQQLDATGLARLAAIRVELRERGALAP